MVLRKTNFFLCMMITSWHTPYFCDGELSAIISKRHKAIQATAAERAHHETSLCKSIVSLSFYFLLFLLIFFPSLLFPEKSILACFSYSDGNYRLY